MCKLMGNAVNKNDLIFRFEKVSNEKIKKKFHYKIKGYS